MTNHIPPQRYRPVQSADNKGNGRSNTSSASFAGRNVTLAQRAFSWLKDKLSERPPEPFRPGRSSYTHLLGSARDANVRHELGNAHRAGLIAMARRMESRPSPSMHATREVVVDNKHEVHAPHTPPMPRTATARSGLAVHDTGQPLRLASASHQEFEGSLHIPPPPLPPRSAPAKTVPLQQAAASWSGQPPPLLSTTLRHAEMLAHSPIHADPAGSLPTTIQPRPQASARSVSDYTTMRCLIGNQHQNPSTCIVYGSLIPGAESHFLALDKTGINIDAIKENRAHALAAVTQTLQDFFGYGDQGSVALKARLPEIFAEPKGDVPTITLERTGRKMADLARLPVFAESIAFKRSELASIVEAAHACAAEIGHQ